MTRTIADLMRDGAVAEAIARATGCFDWRTIANALPAGTDPTEVAHRLLTAACAEHEVWGIRDAARLLAERSDLDGAHAALEAGIAMLAAPPDPALHKRTRGYEWVILGRGGDADQRRRCLDAGLAMARASGESDDLIEIATEWTAVNDRAEGLELLRDAEQFGTARPWTIANAWHALGELAEVHRVLDRALAAATTPADAEHVARAWASHDNLAAATAAHARGEILATTAADWLELAETAFDLGLGEAGIRRCLERAAATGEDRARVAAGYKLWVDDDAAAAALGPRGVRPDALRPRLRSTDQHATAEPLFDGLRARITPAQLRSIARADYGMDYAKHLAALEDVCATGLVPQPLPWVPHEVLALYRWGEGDRVDHLARGLCALLLCFADDELVTNGPILLESCGVVGADVVAFFAWCVETAEYQPDVEIARLLLVLAGVPGTLDLDVLEGALADSMRVELWCELLDAAADPDLALLAAVLKPAGDPLPKK